MKTLMLVCSAVVLFGQAPAPGTPFAEFEEKIAQYMKLRGAQEADTGKPGTTSSPTQLDGKKKALGEKIRAARATAKQGDIFTPAIAQEFRRVIATQLDHKGKQVRQSIRSGELVNGNFRVNDSYPDKVPLETMPPTLLQSLPSLPKSLDFRLIGSTLALRDIDANLIIDFVPNALPPK